jgi:hypothetical protein
MYVYNSDAQISKYFIEMNYTLDPWQQHIIYIFLANLHKPEVIFIYLYHQCVYKANTIYFLKMGLGLFKSPKTWMMIYFNKN